VGVKMPVTFRRLEFVFRNQSASRLIVRHFGRIVCSGDCLHGAGIGNKRKRECYNSGTSNQEYNFGFHIF
jgi:hypothetical protein